MKRFVYIVLLFLFVFLVTGCTNLEEKVAPSVRADESKASASEASGEDETASPSQTAPQESETAQPSAKNSEELKSEMNKLNDTLDELKNLFNDVDFSGMDEF